MLSQAKGESFPSSRTWLKLNIAKLQQPLSLCGCQADLSHGSHMQLKQGFPSRQARREGSWLLPWVMTSHTLQRGELGSRLEQTPGAALPQALCSSCSLGKLCKPAHSSQLVEKKVSAQHHASESSKRLFLSRSSCSSPCRTPPLNQAHKQPVFKEEVQLYSAGKGRCRGHLEKKSSISSQKERGGRQGKKPNRWVFGGLPLTFIWNILITYLIHIHSWPIASCSDILEKLTNSLTLLCRLSHNPSWVALLSELAQLPIGIKEKADGRCHCHPPGTVRRGQDTADASSPRRARPVLGLQDLLSLVQVDMLKATC